MATENLPKKPKRTKAQIKEHIKEQVEKLAASEVLHTDSEWLQHLYTTYTENFRHDNDRIWNIGSFIIPLSLAGLTALNNTDRYTIWLLAIGSIVLFGFWYLFAENHRAYQCYNKEVAKQIEHTLNFKLEGRKINQSKLTEFLPVRRLRLIMFVFVIIVWSLAIHYVTKSDIEKEKTNHTKDIQPIIITGWPKLSNMQYDSLLPKHNSVQNK